MAAVVARFFPIYFLFLVFFSILYIKKILADALRFEACHVAVQNICNSNNSPFKCLRDWAGKNIFFSFFVFFFYNTVTPVVSFGEIMCVFLCFLHSNIQTIPPECIEYASILYSSVDITCHTLLQVCEIIIVGVVVY